MTQATLQFAIDHPCGAGHFPGNPIIPGALLLDEVLAVIARETGAGEVLWQVKSVKFPQPVRPGETVHIDFRVSPSGEIKFDCTVSGAKVMTGSASHSHPTSGGAAP